MSAKGDETSNLCAPIIAIGREEVLLDNENSKPTSEGKKSHGFHLVRSKWDPYPWIDSVESGSSAEFSGLRSGDCLLEIDGRDVLGLEMKDIAHLMGKSDRVNLSIWRQPSKSPNVQSSDEDFINLNENDSSDATVSDCNDRGSSLLDGPLPEVSRRLVRAVSGVVKALECPVCLESAAPPVSQCVHGHLLCFGCRLKSSRCPVCRVRLGQGRCLLADKTHRALSEALVRPNKRASLPASLSAKFEREDLNAPSRSLYASIFGSPSPTHLQNSSKNRRHHHHHEDEHQKQRKRNKERSPMRQFLHRLVHSSSSSSSTPGLLNRSSRRRANNNDDRAASTESLPTTSSHDRENNRSDLNLLHVESGSNISLTTSKAHHNDEDDDDEDESTAGCSMDGNLLYGRRWLLRLYDRRKSASTGELHRGASRRERDNEDETMERLAGGADDEGRRRRRDKLEDRPSSGLLSVPQTPIWGGSTESMMISKICCPLKRTAGCTDMIQSDSLMEHLQQVHTGPIIHFYKREIILPFPFSFQKEAVYAICLSDDTFILQSHDSKIWMCSPKANEEILWRWSVEEANDDYPKTPTMKDVASLLAPFNLLDQNVIVIPEHYSGLLRVSVVELDSLGRHIDV